MPYQLILSIRLRLLCYMGSTHLYLNLVLKEDRTSPFIVTIWYHKGMTSEVLSYKIGPRTVVPLHEIILTLSFAVLPTP